MKGKPSFLNAFWCCTAINNCLQPTFNFLNNSFISFNSSATHVACREKSYKCLRKIIKTLTFPSTTRRPINNCSKKHTQYENFCNEAIVHFPSFMHVVIGSIRQLLSGPCLSKCIISVTQFFPLKAPNKKIRLLKFLVFSFDPQPYHWIFSLLGNYCSRMFSSAVISAVICPFSLLGKAVKYAYLSCPTVAEPASEESAGSATKEPAHSSGSLVIGLDEFEKFGRSQFAKVERIQWER